MFRIFRALCSSTLIGLVACSPTANQSANSAGCGAVPAARTDVQSSSLPSAPPSSSTIPAATAANREPAGPIRHVWVVTIDGMLPETYTDPDAHGLQIPMLRHLAKDGAASDGALSVFPSLTYPAHTSIASGVRPARHGIVSNQAHDPLDLNHGAWRWYASEVKVPRIWDVAYTHGYRTALLDWPVTVGARATYHVPEFWRSRTDEDLKLIRALSTPPNLIDLAAATHPHFLEGFHPQDVSDEAGVDLVETVMALGAPHLLFLHIWQVDAAQHHFGLWSPEALHAIENADHQVERLWSSIEHAGLAPDSALVVASDHGFANIDHAVKPGALLQQAGLVKLDAKGKVTDFDASLLANHGSAFVYLDKDADAALQERTLASFQHAAGAPHPAIGRIVRQPQITEMGGDPNAFLALIAATGTTFVAGYDKFETAPPYRATHGYDPEEPAMRASLILFGPQLPKGKLVDARLIDVAPTIAEWLDLPLPDVEGSPLRVAPR